MSNENELLGCPFCGGEAEAVKSPLQLGLWRVGCKITGCLGRMPLHATWGFTTEAKAIVAWNRRPILSDETVGWQTIETAPSGYPVMLYEPEVASGRGQLPARIVVERYPTTYPRPATHWMPLPAALAHREVGE